MESGAWMVVHRDNSDTNRMLDIGAVDLASQHFKAWLSTRWKKGGALDFCASSHKNHLICWMLEKTFELLCSFTTAKYVEWNLMIQQNTDGSIWIFHQEAAGYVRGASRNRLIVQAGEIIVVGGRAEQRWKVRSRFLVSGQIILPPHRGFLLSRIHEERVGTHKSVLTMTQRNTSYRKLCNHVIKWEGKKWRTGKADRDILGPINWDKGKFWALIPDWSNSREILQKMDPPKVAILSTHFINQGLVLPTIMWPLTRSRTGSPLCRNITFYALGFDQAHQGTLVSKTLQIKTSPQAKRHKISLF